MTISRINHLIIIVAVLAAQITRGQIPKDGWTTIGMGGGGAMFNPAVSPRNPDYAFVACDMGGSYVTHDGGKRWRMFNLRGPVDFFAFDPLDSNIVYANSSALFKSADHGKTWSVLYPAASDIAGIVSRGDHAQEVMITKDSTRRKVLAFAVDPADSKKLYAAISIDKTNAFYTSNDGGKVWNKEHQLQEEAKNIFIVPSSNKTSRTVYVTGSNSVTVKENGNWRVNKAPDVSMIITYTGGFDKNRNKYIIYGISGKSYFNPKGDKSGIWYSENGGANWENRESGLMAYNMKGADIPEWRTVATSALHPNVVYVSYNRIKINNDTSCIGVAKSEDFGKTWKLAWRDILSKNGSRAANNFKTGWLEDRFSPGWADNPFSIGVGPNDPAVCYGTDFGRTVKTADGGNTWEQLYTNGVAQTGWTSRGLEVTTGYHILFDPFDKTNLFMCNTDVGLMKSTNGGKNWSSITKSNGIPRRWENSTYWLAFDPAIKNKAWAAMSGTHDLPRPKMWIRNGISKFTGGIVLTEDGGRTWKPLTSQLGETAVTHILVDETSSETSRTIYACAFGKGVYKSVDGGKTWQLKNNGIAGKEPFAWRIFKRDKDGVLFLVVSRRSEDGSIGNEMDGALYRSDDGAESWKPLALPEGTNGPTSLMFDAENPTRIMLSAWGRPTKGKLTPDTGGGIYLSNDEGTTWQPVLQQDQHIHDITYDPRIKTYYACGFNGSAYRSEDFGKTWNRIKGYNFKWGKRVDLDERDPNKIFIITFGGGVWYGPAKGDATAVEDIVTPVLAYDAKR